METGPSRSGKPAFMIRHAWSAVKETQPYKTACQATLSCSEPTVAAVGPAATSPYVALTTIPSPERLACGPGAVSRAARGPSPRHHREPLPSGYLLMCLLSALGQRYDDAFVRSRRACARRYASPSTKAISAPAFTGARLPPADCRQLSAPRGALRVVPQPVRCSSSASLPTRYKTSATTCGGLYRDSTRGGGAIA